MLDLAFTSARGKGARILCVGAHCDDIEIGCGATLRVLQRSSPTLRIECAVLSGEPGRRAEAERAIKMLVRSRSRGPLTFGDFPDGLFPSRYEEIKQFFERLKKRSAADVVLCHEREDRHQDHRMVNECVWSTFRDHLILEYEIPKWDGGLGQPNVYVPVTAGDARSKVQALLRAHRSQARRDWFTRDTFTALLRLRGLECRSPSGLAEAFHGRKIRVGAR